jgi:hypothetical protein
MLLMVAVVATALAIAQIFWVAGIAIGSNYRLLLAFFLLLVSVAIVAAIPAAARFRPGFIGASLFGVLYLLCILNDGFKPLDGSYAEVFVRRTLLGYAMLGLSFMSAQLIAVLVWPAPDAQNKDDRVP